MKTTITFNAFKEAFDKTRPEHFSDAGLEALYNYLCDLEDSTGTEFELDVIAFCCDFTEYASFKEFQHDYVKEYKSLDDVRDDTTVVEIDGTDGFIIQIF